MSVFLAVVTAFTLSQSAPLPDDAVAVAELAGEQASQRQQSRPVIPQALRQPSRPPQATPRARRVYYDDIGRLVSPGDPTGYQCEHAAGATVISCWCNWKEDATDCQAMIKANVCGDNATWWGSDVEGEYGCDSGG
ncbi:hypothetical protein [Maricaulis sp. CAU 1757]